MQNVVLAREECGLGLIPRFSRLDGHDKVKEISDHSSRYVERGLPHSSDDQRIPAASDSCVGCCVFPLQDDVGDLRPIDEEQRHACGYDTRRRRTAIIVALLSASQP